MRISFIVLSASLASLPLLGCSGDKGAGSSDSGASSDGGTGEGDGSDGTAGETWRASGTGIAYLVDGTEANSLFHLEVNNASGPRSGEAYYGFLSGGTTGTVSLGEITVDDSGSLVFETDIGFNGLVDGMDSFAAFMASSEDDAQSGEPVWSGQINPELRTAYEELLIADPATVDGSGSLRSIALTAQAAQDVVTDALGLADLAGVQVRGETISNGLQGLEEDLNNDEAASTLDGVHPILREGGGIELVLEDLSTASFSVEPGHPVKDLANYAYDCTQRIEGYVRYAANRGGVASVSASTASAQEKLIEAQDNLDWALSGRDDNSDGSVDDISEGTIGCAVTFVSQMAYMDVTTP